MSSYTMDAVLIPRFLLLSLILTVCYVLLWWQGKFQDWNFLRSPLLWPFYLLFIAGLISLTQVVNPSEAAFPLLRELLMLLYLLLFIKLIISVPDALKIILPFFSLAHFIVVYFALLQWLQIRGLEMDSTYLVSSTLAHRNLAVSAMVLFIPLSAGTILYGRKWMGFIAAVLILCSLLLVFLLGARSGQLGLILLLVISSAFYLYTRAKWRIPLRLISISAIIILSLMLVVYAVFMLQSANTPPNAELKGGLPTEEATVKSFTVDERIFLWKASGRMIHDQGVLGAGAGQWRILFPKYGSDIYRSRQGMVQFQRPHNDFIWILAEYGIIGLLVLSGIFLLLFYVVLKLLHFPELLIKERIFIALLAGGLMAFATASFFSFPRERIIHPLLFHSFAACISGMYFLKFPPGRVGLFKFAPFAAIISAFIFWTGLQFREGEVSARKMLQMRSSGNWQGILHEFEQNGPNAFYTLDPTALPLRFYPGLALINLQRYREAGEIMEQANEDHPYNVHVLNNLANSYLFQGLTGEAVKYFEQALMVSPKFRDAQLNLTAAYFNQGEVQKAFEWLCSKAANFKENKAEEERFKQYMLTIIRVIRDNKSDQTPEAGEAESLSNLDDIRLWEIYAQTDCNYLTLNRHLEMEASMIR